MQSSCCKWNRSYITNVTDLFLLFLDDDDDDEMILHPLLNSKPRPCRPLSNAMIVFSNTFSTIDTPNVN